ncbi:MAG: hypothetical protein J3R72DRAFT_436725 [Linnemannia gamsii]|nr:MAG: hypothetical protein J3R72DRAFT_436725 [Linnemannia gamsii]
MKFTIVFLACIIAPSVVTAVGNGGACNLVKWCDSGLTCTSSWGGGTCYPTGKTRECCSSKQCENLGLPKC